MVARKRRLVNGLLSRAVRLSNNSVSAVERVVLKLPTLLADSSTSNMLVCCGEEVLLACDAAAGAVGARKVSLEPELVYPGKNSL